MLKTGNILTALFISLLLCSCAKSKLNHDVVPAGETSVTLRIDLHNVVDSPEQMYIVANRMIGTKHFSYLYDCDKHTWKTYDPVSGEEAVDENEDEADTVAEPTIWLNGEYAITCFEKNPEIYPVAGLDEFAVNDKFLMKDISVTLPKDESEDILRFKFNDENGIESYIDFTDFNPCLGFIVDAGNFYTSSLSNQEVSPDNVDAVVLTPSKITQNVEINFSVKCIEEIVDGNKFTVNIDDIKTFISGAAARIYPMTSIVSYLDLYKLNMPVRLKSPGEYSSKANFFGLFPSATAEPLHGNGIFQVVLLASLFSNALDDNGNVINENDKKFVDRKIFYAAINLKNIIEAEGLMKLNANQTGYIASKHASTLDIADVLTISRNGVIGSTAADGVDKWHKQEYIDVEM